jgi:hypothetical protein
MKFIKTLVTAVCVGVLLAVPAFAAEKTCCEKAKAEGKDCAHPCCVKAHKDGKSCEKCNPNKEDRRGDMTCCEKAKAEGKDCPHKCCVAAKKDGKTCEKCNSKKKQGQTK